MDFEQNFIELNFFNKFNLSQEDKNSILKSYKVKTFKKDEVIYPKYDCFGYIMIISGKFKANIHSENFKEIAIFELIPNDSCAICSYYEIKFFNIEMTFKAIEDTTVIVIPNYIYKKLQSSHIDIANHTYTLVSNRLSKAINVMKNAIFIPLPYRVEIFLNEHNVDGVVKTTHQDIANYLGTSREVISRILQKLEDEGKIVKKRGLIQLKQNLNM